MKGVFIEEAQIPTEETMRVVLDNIIFSLQRAGGASAYWTELIKGLAGQEDLELSFIERHDAEKNLFRQSMAFKSFAAERKDRSLRIDQFSDPRVDKDAIFHSSCYRVAKGESVKNITTVYDFIGTRYFTGPLKVVHDGQIKRAVNMSDALICISESTKRDLLAFIPAASHKPIETIHLAYDSASYTYKPMPRKNQVIFIGARTPYKNFELAVRSVSCAGDVELLIIGAPLTAAEKRLADNMLPDRYQVQEFPSSKEVNRLYRESIALLYLSEYEGFGLPVLEAMASGLPVIALNKSSIPEVAGSAGILLDDASPDVVADAIRNLMNDSTLFDECVQKGICQAKRFSWGRTIKSTIDFYQEIWNMY